MLYLAVHIRSDPQKAVYRPVHPMSSALVVMMFRIRGCFLRMQVSNLES